MEEELEALEAIFPDDFKPDPLSPNAYIFTTDLDQDEELKSPRTFSLTFFLPPKYPEETPVYQVHSVYCGAKRVDEIMLNAIDQGFQSLFEPGQVVLFEWISWLREYLEEHVPKAEHLPLEIEQPSVEEITEKVEQIEIVDNVHERPTVKATRAERVDKVPDIFSSEPLVDRKSVFVAHVAKVESTPEVRAVLSTLLENKKIAKATHNIMAYRIMTPDGKLFQDNDDDGETAAGSRLLHLMQILQVENVVVVVTRWFGGIHLGPDRFKDINNVARTALEAQGFVKQQPNQQKSNKKKK
ncbi:hypothetical protein G6F56_008879 [Rhizopus delemar]|nr:hypothetical protein G6F56_008879 [Rhizopus delemar]